MRWSLFSRLASQIQAAYLIPPYRGRYGYELFGDNLRGFFQRTLPHEVMDVVVEKKASINPQSIEQTLDVYQTYVFPVATQRHYEVETTALEGRTKYFQMLVRGEGKPLIQNDAGLARKLYDTICTILFASLAEFDKPADATSKHDAGIAKVVLPMISTVNIALSEFPPDSHLSSLFLAEEFIIALTALLKSPIEKERGFVVDVIMKSVAILSEHNAAHGPYCVRVLRQIELIMANAQQAKGSHSALRPMSEIPRILELILPQVEMAEMSRFLSSSLIPAFKVGLFGDALIQAVGVTASALTRLSQHDEDAFRDVMMHILKPDPNTKGQAAENSIISLQIGCIKRVQMDPHCFAVTLMRILETGRAASFPYNEWYTALFLCDQHFIKAMAPQSEAVLSMVYRDLLKWLQQRKNLTDDISKNLLSLWQQLQSHVHFPIVVQAHPELFSSNLFNFGPNLMTP